MVEMFPKRGGSINKKNQLNFQIKAYFLLMLSMAPGTVFIDKGSYSTFLIFLQESNDPLLIVPPLFEWRDAFELLRQ